MKRSIIRMQDPILKLPRHTLLAHSVRYLGVLLASLLCSLNIQALEPKKVLGFGDMLEPQPYQVFQRDRIDSGPIRIRACLPTMDQSISSMEWSWVADGVASAWFPLAVQWDDTCFQAQVRLPAGGWYTLRLRDRDDRAKTHEIKYIGVGEVFVVAGQSNAANHGEAIMEPRSDRVVSLSQDGWQPAKDPQPGASGRRGSFMPTLGLSNTICLKHLADSERDYPRVRIFATLGWIAAGLAISFVFQYDTSVYQCYVAAGAALVVGVYSFFLPGTPPPAKGEKVSFGELVGAGTFPYFKKFSFAVFMIASLLVCCAFMPYWANLGPFLGQAGMEKTTAFLTWGQIAELPVLFFVLPIFLKKFGIKWTMIIGIFCWILRYFVFATAAG
ncbi:MAG: hypothetical protein EBU26_03845, partial [Verrucomicrobia bacterium]|nr:hypothetical protein [Verrucomicrobiota bacterium]